MPVSLPFLDNAVFSFGSADRLPFVIQNPNVGV